jgi:hypothetical protein
VGYGKKTSSNESTYLIDMVTVVTVGLFRFSGRLEVVDLKMTCTRRGEYACVLEEGYMDGQTLNEKLRCLSDWNFLKPYEWRDRFRFSSVNKL